MSSLDQEILKVVRLVAVTLMGVTFFLYMTDIFLWMAHRPSHGTLVMILKALPLVAGLVVLWKSKALADYFSNRFD